MKVIVKLYHWLRCLLAWHHWVATYESSNGTDLTCSWCPAEGHWLPGYGGSEFGCVCPGHRYRAHDLARILEGESPAANPFAATYRIAHPDGECNG